MSQPAEQDQTNQDGSPSADRREAAFRVVLGLAAIVMLGLSRPLWTGSESFPRVPFVPGLPESDGIRWTLFVVLVGSIVAGMVHRRWILIGLVPLVYLVLGDQHRFQPWVYQYALMSLALGTLPKPWALGCCRLFLVSLYIHSGLSKLDTTFAREVGTTFLRQLFVPLGYDPLQWPFPLRALTAMAMPAGELLVGLGLAIRKTRAIAIAGAVLMHVILIGILGPWGLDHSTIVLVWNTALIVEVVVLFGRTGPGRSVAPLGPIPGWSAPVVGLFALAAVLPMLERRGRWDSWPSFALYASHAERVYIYLHESAVSDYPDSVRLHWGRGPWRELDLTAWSRAERGTPPYPSARAAVGVAEALADWPGTNAPVHVIVWSRADRVSGRRTRLEAIGSKEIHRLADRFSLNAHPAIEH